jgi:hypothetical protein
MQNVTLPRRPTFQTVAATWKRNTLFIMKRDDLDPLFAALEFGANEFARDFSSVNPKKPTKQ